MNTGSWVYYKWELLEGKRKKKHVRGKKGKNKKR